MTQIVSPPETAPPERTVPACVLLVGTSATQERVRLPLAARYRVEAAADGAAALLLARGQAPDLILAEGVLPDIDGPDFLHCVRAVPATAGIPVLFLSASADEETRARALEAGADDYLVTPVGQRELLARVHGHLERARTRREAAAAARDARGRLDAVVESMDDHLVTYDREWRYTSVNDRAARVLGKRKEELLGRCIWDLFPEAVGNQYYEELHQALAEQKVIRSEHYYAPWDVWFENHMYPFDGGVTVFSHDVTARKTAEQLLRRSEARYRALVEASSQVVWTWNPKTGAGDYEAVQRWWEEKTGQIPRAQSDSGWLDVVHPDDRERAQAAWDHAMGTGAVYDVEYRVCSRAGEYHHILARAVPVRDLDAPIVEWVGMLLEVTEQKAAEDALRQSREWLKMAQLAAGAGAWEWDLRTGAVTWSEGYYSLLGLSPGSRPPAWEAWFEAVHPEDREYARRKGDAAIRSRKPIRSEYRLVRADGAVRWHYSVGETFCDAAGQPERVVGMSVDVTARKCAEIALQQTNDTLQALIDASPLALMILEMDGTVRLWNPAAERIFGWTAEEVLGRFLPAVPDERQDEFRANLERVAGGEPILGMVTRRQKRGGVPFDAALWAVALPDDQGRVRCMSIVEDITERVRLEAELEQRVAELAEADRRKDEFLAMLAHELRNPLAPILSAAYVLQVRGQQHPVLVRQREIITRQTQHMARLLDDLLDVSLITRGTIELRPQALDLAAIVDRVRESCLGILEERGHHFSVSLPEDPISVYADLARLHQVLSNLLGNAAKYTSPGGRIDLSGRREGSEAVISVRDSGIGISADLLPRVFDLFTQGDRSLARTEGGLGIGLTMVKRLVEMHGGSIEARSDGPGCGSEFILRLPAANRPPPAAPLPAGRPAVLPASGRRILIVDDIVDAAESLGELLTAWGHEVRLAHGGQQALRLAAAFHPEIVLLDIGLPGTDGYEVARRLRSLPAGAALYLAALTGYGQEEDRRRAADAGFDCHLTKPAEPERLQEAIQQAAGRRH
jgi:PAS domain S-box-containing protein